ncbi:MAG TPA: hypothetical protein VNM15_02620 [Candidatus Binatia bacterium]|nr:hypothetical protein [Candidatus Binatia bacterium]
MDTLVRKAWELYQYTAGFSVETILMATVWLEEKHRKTPSDKIAMAIALHYLILALRQDASMESEIARDYCTRAARWQTTACESTVAALVAKATEDN